MSASPQQTQCPRCQQEKAKIVAGQRAVCSLCSKSLQRVYQFCWACQRAWQGENCSDSCELPWCGLRAALLSAAVFTDPGSSVCLCPFFRACPSCKALLMHSGDGCPCINCPECKTSFCFRCLKEECDGYGTFYDDSGEDVDSDDDDDDDYDDMCSVTDYDYEIPCTVVDNREALTALGI